MIPLQVYPSFPVFKKLAKQGNLIPIFLDVMADQLTPVSLLASHWKTSPHCFLLESVEGGENLGRYSIVSFEPDMIIQEAGGNTEIKSHSSGIVRQERGTALSVLERHLMGIKPVSHSSLPRFYGGAVGYMGYEAVRQFERIPQTKPDHLKWPTSCFYLTKDLYVFDNTQQILKTMTSVSLPKGANLKRAYDQAKSRLLRNIACLKKTSGTRSLSLSGMPDKDRTIFTSNMTKGAFKQAVEKAKEYIRQGDIIQVVLSRRMERKTTASPLDIYRSLRIINPSPYMYLFRMKGRAVIGSSPESLVRLENDQAMTRPIAGTRWRGRNANEDLALEKELLKDPKERAEHVMLVDLGRNDIGRVCQYGSVRVPQFMAIERYSHVMHIVSEVVGKIKNNKTCFDLLRSVFPAGTVSGAPKIRAMEIIDELETSQRGPYAGAIGYMSFSGNMDMAITIRTLLYDSGRVSIQVGAGIVADSIPKREYLETENKAQAMIKTVFHAESKRKL